MSAPEPSRTATVLALDSRQAEQNPRQPLASGDGMVVSWTDGPALSSFILIGAQNWNDSCSTLNLSPSNTLGSPSKNEGALPRKTP
jgi:hypothetical protein